MKNRRLRSLIKQGAVSALATAGVFPTIATPNAAVRSLMHSLHPRRSSAGLIRVGPAGDGGYLVPDDLEGIAACYSPGVGDIVGFERDCAARGMLVFMADGSVDSPIMGDPVYSFIRKFIGAINTHDSSTMNHWVESTMPESRSDLLLQIDIEGSEYETFLQMSDVLLRRFRIIAAEFHTLDQLWSKPFFGIASRAFRKILQSHACVHIHPNNCTVPVNREGLSIPPVMEFTFLRLDRLAGDEHAREFPHPLDAANDDGVDLALPPCWYRQD